MEKKKLVLNKQVIAELSDKEKRSIVGGRRATDPQVTDNSTCIECPTTPGDTCTGTTDDPQCSSAINCS